MRFAFPFLFLLLPLLALGGWLLYRGARARARRKLALFASAERLASLLHRVDARAKRRKFLLVALSLSLLILAMTRPLWGPKPNRAAQTGAEFFVILDVSKSMWVADVKPNRLAAVKTSLDHWLKTLRGDRVGLILMAGDAIIQAPLTNDYTALREVLAQSGPGSISLGGSNIPEAIGVAAKALESSNVRNKVVVLISDGENLEGRPVEDVRRAHLQEKITFFTVGVGTAEGGLVPRKEQEPPLDETSGGSGRVVADPVKDEYGVPVRSRLDERNLRSIASAGGGRYFQFDPESEIWSTLYGQGLAALARKSDAINPADYHELFQIPLLLAMLLLGWEMTISTRKKNPARPRFVTTLPEPAPASVLVQAGGIRHPAKSRAVVAAVLLSLSAALSTGRGAPAAEKLLTMEEAQALVQSGKAEEAAGRLRSAAQKKPTDLYLMYNYGIASYAAENYGDAINAFIEASLSDEKDLRARALMQLGNAQYRLGETLHKAGKTQGTLLAWERAIEYYQSAVAEKSTRTSKRNLFIVREKLEGMLMTIGENNRAEAIGKIGTDGSIPPLTKAFESFGKVVELNPENRIASERLEETRKQLSAQMRNRAQSLFQRGQEAVESEEKRKEAERKNPKVKAESLLNTQRQQQRTLYTKADETYRKAREIDPANADLAREHEEFRRVAADHLAGIAAGKLEEALNTIRPEDTNTYGKHRLKQERLKATLAEIEKAFSFDETNARAKGLEAEALKSLEESYITNADASKALADKHPDTFHDTAVSQYRDALDNYQRALALNPENRHAREASAEVTDSLARRLADVGNRELESVQSSREKESAAKSGEGGEPPDADSGSAQELLRNIAHLEKAAQSFAQAEALAPGKNHAAAMEGEANNQLDALRGELDQIQNQPGASPGGDGKSADGKDQPAETAKSDTANPGDSAKPPLGLSEIRGGTEKQGQFRDLRQKARIRDW